MRVIERVFTDERLIILISIFIQMADRDKKVLFKIAKALQFSAKR